ncbi:MAG: CHASE4 domain-containing protein [Candidatus Thermoplasmatota archaeon]
MDLEKKTFLIILATLTVVAGLAAVVADRLVLESFRTLERTAAEEDMELLQASIAGDLADLDRTAQDWAHWDDAYAFVQGLDPDFEQSNLVPNSFDANDLALMVFLDANDDLVFGAAYDSATGNLTDLPARFAALDPLGPLLAHPDDFTSVSGLLGADGQAYLVASWPILTSTEQGPPVGTLVWARRLDLEALSSNTRLQLTLRPWDASDSGALADGSELTAISRNTLLAEARLDDLNGAPVFVVEAGFERPIYRQGLNTMAYVFASAILMGGGLLVAMIVLLNTTVLSRLTRLTTRVESFGEDPHGRLEVSGSDEITRLSIEFNGLLDRLDRHQTRLEASNADLRHFAAVVSHDLQPPLSTIALNSAILREHNRGKLDEETMERLQRMEGTALRMANHIRAILDYSRVSFEAANLGPVDLSATMAEVTEHLEERLQATKGRIEATNLPTIEANPTQMVQLLQNLVANGLKFHRPGIPPRVKVSARALDDGHVRITVEDNGEGFDPADFERMRKPYIRLPGRGHEGHGLGLATADKIVERHHGRLWAESQPGCSRFHVDLPTKQ